MAHLSPAWSMYGVVLILISALGIFEFLTQGISAPPKVGAFYFFRLLGYGGLAAIALSPIVTFFDTLVMRSIALLVIGYFSIYGLSLDIPASRITFLGIAGLWILLGLALVVKQKWKCSTSLICIVYSMCHWLLMLFIGFLHLRSFNSVAFTHFVDFKPWFVWCMGLVALVRDEKVIDSHWLINPVHGVKAVLWPRGSKLIQSTEIELYRINFWNGVSNVLIGYLNFILAFLLLKSSEDTMSRVVTNYLVYVLADVATFNVMSGMARLYGYKVPDATRFVVLAQSPADCWRRGSVYNYLFIQEYIFWPLVRWCKNINLALFLAFSAFYINQFQGPQLWYWFGGSVSHVGFERQLELGRAYLFLIYFLILLISRKYWPWQNVKFRNSPYLGWSLVALTHVVNMAALYLAYGILVSVMKV